MVFSLLGFTRDDILGPLGLINLSHTFFFELIDMFIMALVIGYIFSDYLRKPMREDHDPLTFYKKPQLWENVKFAALVAGPAVVLHELVHKVVAMLFGAEAILYAPYGFYILIAFLKMIGFPLLFFVGGFVSHSPLSPLQSALVSISGPLVNFALWGAAIYAVKRNLIKKKYYEIAIPFAKINLFLGIFNLIPLPGFDGWNFLLAILSLF